ncbi:MAG: ribonuclease H-like domain-containing protein [Candidatus Omnitrophica bacterium]|nr:ribonuclease H-like domain-containing protein [Candidatus Omnitrophota bacterium]MDD5574857.1 ribonuclease H-like domain-containing protein [Candidatus Omnitrophota bacterium]
MTTNHKIIFDIETVGAEFDTFDQATQEYLLKFAKTDEEEQEVRDSLSFYPVTAQIVTIAMLEAETDKASVYYQVPSRQPERTVEGETEYFSVPNEKQLLELFWSKISKYDTFITFNGRGFDCPFILVRSAVHRLKATKNLMPDRYRSNMHVDLMEKLTFLGAVRRRFSLHVWCNAFGIKSPKEEGVTGLDVKNLFKDSRHLDIARYCLRDVAATRELYHYWDKYMNFPV